MRYTKTTLEKIQKLFEDLDYTIRYERGNFQSGYCMVEERKIAVINKFFDVESRINTLIEILSSIEVDQNLLSDKSKDMYKKISKKLSPNEVEEGVLEEAVQEETNLTVNDGE